jgi:myo-inositol-1(or 4)-monophosphatase
MREIFRDSKENDLSDELQFGLSFAAEVGHYMKEQRETTKRRKKLDGTDVTDVDEAINKEFERRVAIFSNGKASVKGEESSRPIDGSSDVWIIDPVDGTGKYIDDTLVDAQRTSCVGIALFKNGRPQLSVVCNPFRDELFYADKDLGGAYLNRRRLDLSKIQPYMLAKNTPFDYCHWDDAEIDARFFEDMLGRPPIGDYSAIYQACRVAKGESAFAVFPGNTIHDIAPAAILVEAAGGWVSDARGNPLTDNSQGAVYSNNKYLHQDVIRALCNQ